MALPDHRPIRAWAQKIDPGFLPCFGVATPAETSTREAQDCVQRRTTLQVAVKAFGADDGLEAAMDGLSLAVEAAVLAALEPLALMVWLERTGSTIEAGGMQKLATLTLEFAVVRFTDPGACS